MTSTLFALNDAPRRSQRSDCGLRRAGAVAAEEDRAVRKVLMAEAGGCARSGQAVPEGD